MNSAWATPRTRPRAAIRPRLIARKAESSSLPRGTVNVVKIPQPGDVHGGLPYLLTLERRIRLGDDGIHVIKSAGKKLFQQIEKIVCSQLFNQGPQFRRGMDFLDSR